MHARFGKAVVGGFLGTVAMTLLMYFVAPMMLGRPMDVAAMLGSMLGGNWAMGMLMHFVNGTLIFPAAYAYLLYGRLPGAPWLKGLTWGLALWVLLEVMVMPLMGGGFFSATSGGLMAAMAALIAHAVYGAILGGVAAPAEGSAVACACHV